MGPAAEHSLEIVDGAEGFVLSCGVWIGRPRNEVFAFFADAMNLNRITPGFLHFRVLSEEPVRMGVGALIDYQIRLHGIPIRWRTRISAWEPPVRFVDEQIRGPYRRWVHEHVFEEVDGGTLCRDRVEYEVVGGRWVDRVFVRRDLRRIFEYRRDRLLRILDQAGGVGCPEGTMGQE